MKFTPEQVAALSAPLSSTNVKSRKQSGRSLSYVEGWHAIAEANRIFGFDAWTRETLDIRCVAERERSIGQDKRPGWGVSYIAKVRVTVGTVVREGVGSGHGIDVDLGLAHESAIKEAETDAMKRALMTFGNPFGLALYDKDQANVVDERRQPAEQPRIAPPVETNDAPPAEVRFLVTSMARATSEAELNAWSVNNAPVIEGMTDAEKAHIRAAFLKLRATLRTGIVEKAA